MKHIFFFIAILFSAGLSLAQDDANKNKIAILPFHFIINDQTGSEEQVYQIQSDAYSGLMKHHGDLIVQDPDDTNAKLFKAGITLENVRGFTSEEICKALGVEYIIGGTVSQHKKQISSGASSTVLTETPATTNKKGKETSSGGITSSTYSSVYTSDDYTTKLTLKVHNDKGESLYSDSHQSVWSGPEAYKNAFRFLWKKTPLYVK